MSTAEENGDRALRAIRRKYATTADVAKRLGFNEEWEDIENNGGSDMARSSGAPSRDRRARDAEGEELDYLILNPEARNELYETEPAAMDAIRRFVASHRRRGARDQPPPFGGRPEPGGSMTDYDRYTGNSESYDRTAHDRALESARQGGRSWDVEALTAARSHRGASDQLPRDLSFGAMFPSTRRIGHSGF